MEKAKSMEISILHGLAAISFLTTGGASAQEAADAPLVERDADSHNRQHLYL